MTFNAAELRLNAETKSVLLQYDIFHVNCQGPFSFFFFFFFFLQVGGAMSGTVVDIKGGLKVPCFLNFTHPCEEILDLSKSSCQD